MCGSPWVYAAVFAVLAGWLAALVWANRRP
jgi:hypothetical protein